MPFLGRKPEPPEEPLPKPEPKEEPSPAAPISVNVTTPRQAAPVPVPRSPDEISLINLQQISSDFRKYHDYDRNPDSARLLARTIEVELRKLIYEFAATAEEADDKWAEIRQLEKDKGEETAEYVEALHGRLYRERGSLGLEHSLPPQILKPVPADAIPDTVRRELEPWQLEPGDAGVIHLASIIQEAIEVKRLVVLVIDLDPRLGLAFGGGKSQLEYQIIYWTYKLLGLVFDARKDIVFGHDLNRYERLFTEDAKRPWGIDELTQFFDKWSWGEKESKERTKRLELYRKAGRPIVGCAGSIWLLNERMREVIVTDRLMISAWDDRRHTGQAELYHKWGTPEQQDEDENRWGTEKPVERIAFHGLKSSQFNLMDGLAKVALEHVTNEKWTMDNLLASDDGWMDILSGEDAETAPLPPSKKHLSSPVLKT